ncbi:MAG: hypothetical protein ACM3YM_12665 [Sphingomonadales bacterium]
MNWKNIRLELARTRDFPEGSASRAYLLRLPVGDDGLIDEAALRAAPARATVRRHWPSEPDMTGYVIRTPRGWALSYRKGEDDDETIYHLETHAMRQGEYITLTEPDGQKLPFRIASLQPAGLQAG